MKRKGNLSATYVMLGLKGLIAMVHEINKNLSNASIASNSGLTNYVKGVHERMKPFKCDTYKFNFSIMASLKKHVKNFFMKERNLKCENCNISFNLKGNLTNTSK